MKNKQSNQNSLQKPSLPANSVRTSLLASNPLLSPKPLKQKKKLIKKSKALKKDPQGRIEPILTPKRKNDRVFSPQHSLSCDKLISSKDLKRQGLHQQTTNTNQEEKLRSMNFLENLRSSSKSKQFENIKNFNSKPKWINYFNSMYSHNQNSSLSSIQIQNQNLNSNKIVVNLHSERSPLRDKSEKQIASQMFQRQGKDFDLDQNIQNKDIYNHMNRAQLNNYNTVQNHVQNKDLSQCTNIQIDIEFRDNVNYKTMNSVKQSKSKDQNDFLTYLNQNQQSLNQGSQSLYASCKQLPREYLLENVPSPPNDREIVNQQKQIDITPNNFVTFQHQLDYDQHLPTGVLMFEAPLSTSSHKSIASSINEEQPLVENLPLPTQKPQLDHNSILKRSVKSNESLSSSIFKQDQKTLDNQYLTKNPIETVRKLIQGFKIRKLLTGRRLKTLISKVQNLQKELFNARNESKNVNESFSVKQIDMQLKRKKELFVNTLNELIKVPHWYRASKMSDNIRERKRELIRTRLRQQSMNSASANLNRSLLESSFLRDELEAAYQSQQEDQSSYYKMSPNNQLISRDKNQNKMYNSIDNQIHKNTQKTQNQIAFTKQSKNIERNDKLGDIKEKSKNKVTFRESLSNSLNSYQMIQELPQQQQIEQEFTENIKTIIQNQQIQKHYVEDRNIEKIVISFQEIYEQEMEKFKKIKLERSSSRERGIKERSFEVQSPESGIQQSNKTMQKSFSFLQNNYLKSQELNANQNQNDNNASSRNSLMTKHQSKQSQNDSIIIKSQQAFQNPKTTSSLSQVKINFHKKSSTKTLEKIGSLVKSGQINLDSEVMTLSSKQNSTSMVSIDNNQFNNSMKNSQISDVHFVKNNSVQTPIREKSSDQLYFNKLKGKYTKVQSKVDCWHPNNTPLKSPPRSSIQLQQDINSPPAQIKFKSPPSSSMSLTKKSYLKTVQVKECVLITPSTQASYSESGSNSKIQKANKTNSCNNSLSQNFSQQSQQKSQQNKPVNNHQIPAKISRQQNNQHKLKSSRSQDNFFETSQLSINHIDNNLKSSKNKYNNLLIANNNTKFNGINKNIKQE